MSGIFSMVSHCTLQYFPAPASQEQFGCAHFFTLSVAIRLSFAQFSRALGLHLFSRKRYENCRPASVQNGALARGSLVEVAVALALWRPQRRLNTWRVEAV